MKTTTRLALFAFLLFLVSTLSRAQTDTVRTNAKLPDHPRLLLLKGEEKALLKSIQADPVWTKAHGAILAECDRMQSLPPVERIQIGRRLLDKSREALRRIFFLSYAYRLTGQKPYLDRAERELLAVSGFSDWNPSHFLDVAEMTMAVAIGYDWLYNDLSETARTQIREAIQKKGIEPSLEKKNNSWLTATHNWNQVCNAGITFGALAVYENNPEQGRMLVNRAVRTVVRAMADYAPDGAYPEGYSYWGYGTTFNVLLISALERVFRSDFGLSRQPGFMQTADYLLHMTGPSGASFNYSDAGRGGGVQPAMFWFSQKRNDPSLLWVERTHLTADPKPMLGDRILPAMMVWGKGVKINRITPPAATLWAGSGKNPVALFRSSWQDPKAVYVGMKGGSPSVNHAHMDAGSFVLEANGVRWGMDLGMQDYNSLESKGLNIWGKDQNAQRWQVFRYRNEVHSTLTINNELQRVNGNAPLTSYASTPAFQNATTDLSTVYQGSLKTARRGIGLMAGNYVVVRDELEVATQPATVRWSLLTPAEVKITGPNTAELRKDGQTLTLRVQEPAQVTMKTWSTTPPNSYDAPNPGSSVVGFEVQMPAGSTGALTVLLIPEGANVPATPTPALSSWPRK